MVTFIIALSGSISKYYTHTHTHTHETVNECIIMNAIYPTHLGGAQPRGRGGGRTNQFRYIWLGRETRSANLQPNALPSTCICVCL